MHLRLSALALFTAAPLFAEDWSRFRGPNGTGVADSATPTRFALATDLTWMTKLPGVGHGSPIVVGGQVFLQVASPDGATRSLVCLSATDGKVQWEKKVIEGKAGKIHKKSSNASGTPCSDGERVFNVVWDGTGLTMTAHDLKGNELWKKGLGSFASQHGFGHSPITVGGLVIFSYDQDGAAELVAHDAKTGEQKWRVERKPHRASYSTPFLIEKEGKPAEVVVATTTTIDRYDAKTGQVIWSFNVPWDTDKKLRAIGQPVLAGGNVVMFTGDGDGSRAMVAVKAAEKPALAWELKKGTPYVPGGLVYKDHLYWVTDDGQAGCADPKTGKVLWGERLPGLKSVSASPILVGDRVFVVGEDGKAVSFEANPKELKEVEKSDVGEPVFASPAAAGGKLFIRGGTHLFCIGKK
ncbi:MAG: PQQ-binding-like beta-propeller repeat protein [Fimbriiglobus sp.]|nr:PQQ-binding-like beta-propeller repeat protein [Fimbriiglobus sp.]